MKKLFFNQHTSHKITFLNLSIICTAVLLIFTSACASNDPEDEVIVDPIIEVKIDTDNDGVIDSEDDCPTVAGIASLNGCPEEKDTDNDGILDKDDACPTIPGIASLNGCPEETNSSNLDASKSPSENFDLSDWYLSIPINNGSGIATSIKENELNSQYSHASYLYS